MTRKRRSFSSTFKARVALDAIRRRKIVPELAKQHKVHPTQVNLWKKQLIDVAESLLQAGSGHHKRKDELPTVEFYEQIGKLNMQLEWVKNKWPSSVAERVRWIDPTDHHRSERE
jgi:putative transposase